MSRRDIGTDDPRVKVRPSKRSRPRTKVRPDWGNKPIGQVIGIDRGRYLVRYEGLDLRAVLARELKKGSGVVGDRVRLTGDLSGRVDTLARIVATDERSSVLRRSLEDAPDQKGEKIIVANAQIMVIVTALADPPPRMGMIDRCLVAAHEAGMRAVLCLTKADLAPATEFWKPTLTLMSRRSSPQLRQAAKASMSSKKSSPVISPFWSAIPASGNQH